MTKPGDHSTDPDTPLDISLPDGSRDQRTMSVKGNRPREGRAVLGVKLGPQHDSGACVVCERDGQLSCTAIVEERLNREKHSRKMPRLSIEYCLEHQGLSLADVDLVAIDTLTPTDIFGDFTDLDDVGTIEEQRFGRVNVPFLSELRHLGVRAGIVNHHMAHAASAFHVAGFEDAAILVMDGSGSAWSTEESSDRNMWMGPMGRIEDYVLRPSDRRRETQSIFVGRGRSIERLAVSTRSGIGHFYTWVSERIVGFARQEEGKLMGLAGWGEGRRPADLPDLPLDKIFNGIDTPLVEHIASLGYNPPLRPTTTPPLEPFYAGHANWADDILGQTVQHLARTALRLSGCNRLCMAGGVSLNVVANRAILDWIPGRMFIQPAANDMGTPLGAALYGYYNLLRGRLPFQKNIAYLGADRSAADSAEVLSSHGARVIGDETKLDREVAQLLKANRIVGWFQGPSEYGPRALGNRSILCSPREPWMKDHLNKRVKHREAFRPFAPLVREERAPLFFDLYHPVPHLLFNATVLPEYRDRLPAITHVDGSARLQTVGRHENPRMYQLLCAFEAIDDYGVLLNTSFNDSGEPIVETVEDAVRCYERTGLDALVCGNALLVKQETLAIGEHPADAPEHRESPADQTTTAVAAADDAAADDDRFRLETFDPRPQPEAGSLTSDRSPMRTT